MGRPFIKKVLSVPPLELTDDVAASKLLNVQLFGRHVATLHLSIKLWPIFGDL